MPMGYPWFTRRLYRWWGWAGGVWEWVPLAPPPAKPPTRPIPPASVLLASVPRGVRAAKGPSRSQRRALKRRAALQAVR